MSDRAHTRSRKVYHRALAFVVWSDVNAERAQPLQVAPHSSNKSVGLRGAHRRARAHGQK